MPNSIDGQGLVVEKEYGKRNKREGSFRIVLEMLTHRHRGS